MTVRTDVSEADIGKVTKGMNVYFTTLGAGQNRRWYSTVKRREPTPKSQNSVILYPVLFDVENENNTLMPNATTQVFFVVSQARNVLTVPMAALQQGQQIAREMAAKKQKEGGTAGATPGAAGAPGAAPAGAPGGATANVVAGGPASGGSVPPGAPPGGAAGAAPRGGNGGAPGGGGFGGARQGGGGFNPQNMTPEQREEMMARFRERGGAGGAGGFNGGGRFGGMGGGGNGQSQRRNGIVMVKLADGTLEQRRVVIGVTDRVRGEVIEGLKEGEEVIVGKREEEVAAPSTTQQNQNNNFDPRRGGNFSGGFPGGGRF
jgi:macrolide-specific efflux system membrane fusion protein